MLWSPPILQLAGLELGLCNAKNDVNIITTDKPTGCFVDQTWRIKFFTFSRKKRRGNYHVTLQAVQVLGGFPGGWGLDKHHEISLFAESAHISPYILPLTVLLLCCWY